jgi:hypothetical protein
MNSIIETERLILRPLVLSDAETAYPGWVGDADVAEWLSLLPLHSLEETMEWLRGIAWKYDADGNIAENDNYIWGFVLKKSGELSDSGGLIWENGWKLYQVGYNIMKKYWNQGYTQRLWVQFSVLPPITLELNGCWAATQKAIRHPAECLKSSVLCIKKTVFSRILTARGSLTARIICLIWE